MSSLGQAGSEGWPGHRLSHTHPHSALLLCLPPPVQVSAQSCSAKPQYLLSGTLLYLQQFMMPVQLYALYKIAMIYNNH